MNIINSVLLRLFLLPARFYTSLGIDVVKLKSILTCKLIMDDRQPFSLGNWQKGTSEEPVSNATWFAVGIYSLMGLLCMGVFLLGESTMLQFTIFFGIFLVMVTLAIVVDFTRVLIDIRDNYIILPKPVNDRTFLASRILHIAIHVSKMVIPLSLPAAVVILILHGLLGFIAFFPVLFFATLFSLLLINLTYLAILTISTPEKFKNTINYLQIGMTIAIFGGYQVIPRLISKSVLEKLDLNALPMINFVPPYWFAALWQLITKPAWQLNPLIGAMLAMVIPFLGLFLVVKVFAPAFNKKLTLISGSGDTKNNLSKYVNVKWSVGDAISRFITTTGPERMGFNLCWRMMLRSREFRMQVYPAIGYFLVLMVVFALQADGFNPEDFKLSNSENTFGKLAILYFPSLLMMSALSIFHITPSWKASWIYEMSPTEQPGKIINGGIKAVVAQFMFLPFFLTGIFGFALNGLIFLPVWLMAISLQVMIAYLMNMAYPDYLPFSQPMVGSGGDVASVGKGFIALFILVFLGFFHWLVLERPVLMYIISVLALLVIWQLHNHIKRTPWKKIVFARG